MITKEEWLEKIKSFVPAHFYEEPGDFTTVADGIAKVLEALSSDMDDILLESRIETSSLEGLKAIGESRSIPLLAGETTESYRSRIRNIFNQSNKNAIKKAVDNILLIGESTITGDNENDLFFDRGHFFDRKEVIIQKINNTFSIIIEDQGDDSILDIIVSEVNRIKLAGYFYRILVI